jgi:hypothetical protein
MSSRSRSNRPARRGLSLVIDLDRRGFNDEEFEVSIALAMRNFASGSEKKSPSE